MTYSRDVFGGEFVGCIGDKETCLKYIIIIIVIIIISNYDYSLLVIYTFPTAPSPTTTHLMVCIVRYGFL